MKRETFVRYLMPRRFLLRTAIAVAYRVRPPRPIAWTVLR